MIYLRLTLRLDPKRDEAWVMVGDILASVNQLENARDAYAHAQPGSAEFVNARARMIATYDQASDNAKALALAQDTLKGAPGDLDAQILVADQLRANDRFAESAAILDKVIAAQGAKADWRLFYMRGAALAQADQWAPAEKDLLKGARNAA